MLKIATFRREIASFFQSYIWEKWKQSICSITLPYSSTFYSLFLPFFVFQQIFWIWFEQPWSIWSDSVIACTANLIVLQPQGTFNGIMAVEMLFYPDVQLAIKKRTHNISMEPTIRLDTKRMDKDLCYVIIDNSMTLTLEIFQYCVLCSEKLGFELFFLFFFWYKEGHIVCYHISILSRLLYILYTN